MAFSRIAASRTVLSRRLATTSRTTPSRVWQQASRRSYATGMEGHPGPKPSSDLPWIAGSVLFTVPAAYFLLQSGPETADHGHGHQAHADEKHAEPAHHEPEPEPTQPEAEEVPAETAPAEQSTGEEATGGKAAEQTESQEPPKDEAAAVKPPGDFSTQSGKQEGLSNKDTGVPPASPERLSQKGEGDLDTAKVKGTADTNRPQV